MKIEVFESYDENYVGIGTPLVFEARKPFPREVWKIQNVDPDNMEDDASFDIMDEFIHKCIVKYPEGLEMNGEDKPLIEADAWFKIFRITAGSALAEAKKLSEM